jgi:hypothetical protein
MKSFVCPLFGALLVVSSSMAAATPTASPTEAAKLVQARAIIQVIIPPSQQDAMFAKLQSDLINQMMPTRASWMQDPGITKILDDFLNEAMAKQRIVFKKHLPDQLDAMAQAYSQSFSLAELKEINAFAQTPAGHHYLSESLAIVGDPAVAKANSAAVAEVRAVTEAMAPELKSKVIAYVEAHPELAEKIKAETRPK